MSRPVDYLKMRSFLDQNNVTHEDMDKKWEELKTTNMIVKNLSSNGMGWVDLPEHLLTDMVKRAV